MLSQVAVDVLVALLSFQILLFYQDVNALLDHVHLRFESERGFINRRSKLCNNMYVKCSLHRVCSEIHAPHFSPQCN